MAAVSIHRKNWQQLKHQLVVAMLLLTLLCLHDMALASPSRFSSTVSGANAETSKALQIIATTPSMFGPDDPQWTRGEEILPGAQLAINEINDTSDLLSGYQLEVIPVRVPKCELSEGIVPFVEGLASNRNNIIGIVGYFCHNIAQLLSQIAHSWITQVHAIQISAASIATKPDIAPYLEHSILPLRESITSAIVQLIQSLGWTKIAVISNPHSNFADSTHSFLRAAKEHGIQIVTHLGILISPKELYLQKLQRSGIKITVAFVPQSEAIDILCTAYLNGFRWPNYAWIFMDISKTMIFNANYHCQVEAINNAIFIDLARTKIDPQDILPFGLTDSYSTYYDEELEKSLADANISFQINPYANVLYDSIWAVALTINRSLSVLNDRNLSLTSIHQSTGIKIRNVLEEQLSQLSFQGATGWLNFNHSAAAIETSVEVIQIQNGQPVLIGLYSHSLNRLSLNKSVLGVIPSDTLNRIYVVYPIALTVLLGLVAVLGFTLTMISMCLFIYYRKQPAVRATSYILSLCMFIGCYFLLTSSFFQDITSGTSVYGSKQSLRAFICMFDISILNVGTDIIFATVIAKTLRIYFIFKTFGKEVYE